MFSLEEEVQKSLANSEKMVTSITQDIARNFLVMIFNTKINYFVTKFVQENIEKMISEVWKKHVNSELVAKMIDAELERTMDEIIERKAESLYKSYVAEEIKKIAKRTVKLAEAA